MSNREHIKQQAEIKALISTLPKHNGNAARETEMCDMFSISDIGDMSNENLHIWLLICPSDIPYIHRPISEVSTDRKFWMEHLRRSNFGNFFHEDDVFVQVAKMTNWHPWRSNQHHRDIVPDMDSFFVEHIHTYRHVDLWYSL